jgi:hypothetical protein
MHGEAGNAQREIQQQVSQDVDQGDTSCVR